MFTVSMASIFVVFCYLLICTVNLGYGDRIPPRYVINLDLPPENRWDKVIDDYRELIPAVIEEIHHYVPRLLRPLVWWIDKNIILKEFPEEYAREIRGIAARSGLHIGEVILYTAVTFALNVGIYTGQKHGSFSISINERYSGAYIDTILMELYTHFKKLVTLTIRMALEEKNTFEEAREMLIKEHFIAPSYLIIAGTKSGQACIITRDRWESVDLECTDPQNDRWFLVETNFDHWEVDKDKRRRTAEKALQRIGRYAITYKEMLRILSLHPVKNK
uniref:NAAA-beta domain-containing protein n=1 Tax=Loa loa TaxID=7209 RepID=A0A1I7VUL7_LOALO